MRLGMSGCFLPANMNDVDSAMCRRVRDAGFSGIFTRFRDNDPLTTPRADAERLKALLADEGVSFFQCTGYWQNLVTSDEAARAQSVRVVQAALKLAGWMGARGIDTGPGSMNPAGPWFPHPDNWTAKAENQLYYEAVEGYFARHRVKPGMTGWAQVNGWRGETDTIDKIMQRVNHDLYYIEHWSILFDFYIVLMTPISLISKNENAY